MKEKIAVRKNQLYSKIKEKTTVRAQRKNCCAQMKKCCFKKKSCAQNKKALKIKNCAQNKTMHEQRK